MSTFSLVGIRSWRLVLRHLRQAVPIATLACACLFLGSCATVRPTPTNDAAPPTDCTVSPKAVREICPGNLEPSMADCAVCDGARGCIDRQNSVYCVTVAGCDDSRCIVERTRGRDDRLLMR